MFWESDEAPEGKRHKWQKTTTKTKQTNQKGNKHLTQKHEENLN